MGMPTHRPSDVTAEATARNQRLATARCYSGSVASPPATWYHGSPGLPIWRSGFRAAPR